MVKGRHNNIRSIPPNLGICKRSWSKIAVDPYPELNSNSAIQAHGHTKTTGHGTCTYKNHRTRKTTIPTSLGFPNASDTATVDHKVPVSSRIYIMYMHQLIQVQANLSTHSSNATTHARTSDMCRYTHGSMTETKPSQKVPHTKTMPF